MLSNENNDTHVVVITLKNILYETHDPTTKECACPHQQYKHIVCVHLTHTVK